MAVPGWMRVRLIRDRATSMELAIRKLAQERYEIEKLRALIEQRRTVTRETMRAGAKAIREVSAALVGYVAALDALESSPATDSLGDGVRDVSSDALLGQAQHRESMQRVHASLAVGGQDSRNGDQPSAT